MPDIPYALLVVLILLAVVAGLWVGRRANDAVAERNKDKKGEGWNITGMLRKAATDGVISVWRWNRDRQARAKERERESKK